MPAPRTIVIAAAGTGGHVFPALAVAKAAIANGDKIIWIGTHTGLENRVVPKEQIQFMPIASSGFFGRSRLKKLKSLWQMLRSTFYVARLFKSLKPDMVIGFGGYITMPVGIAAILKRKKLILHEQNAIFGKSNRYLAKYAKRVYTGFPISLPKVQCEYIGNPIRSEIPTLSQKLQITNKRLNLLVLGGSLGAAVFNDVIPKALALLPETLRPCVKHQSGKQTYQACKQNYDVNRVDVIVSPFIENMASAYQWADLVICRAGALTVSEIMAAGKPAIFVPFPLAIDDHQTKNARFLSDKNAAILLPQSELAPEKLGDILQKLDHAQLQAMAANAHALRKISAEKVLLQADLCQK